VGFSWAHLAVSHSSIGELPIGDERHAGFVFQAGFGWIWLDQVGGVKKKWFYLVLLGFTQPNLAQEKCPVFWAQSPKK
jgi:hypothetical protein